MPAPFLLDTNAYFLFFDPSKPPAYHRLAAKVEIGNMKSFYIPEIASLEIHSVIGKFSRRSPAQRQLCKRDVFTENGVSKCSNTWVSPGRKRMPRRLVHDIRKMIGDIEAQRGSVQATIVRLDGAAIKRARRLLLTYGDRFNFASQDALVAGNLLVARETMGIALTLVTSDKGLKAMLAEERIPVYDPQLE